jgi:hypothetical protein
VVVRLTQEEIVDVTARVPTPDQPSAGDGETAFQLPTLLPNTMYAYNAALNVKDHYPEPVPLSPQSTIPVIDLCSTDEEDEAYPVSPVALLRDEDEEVEPVFCDKTSGPNVAVYPVIETPYETYAQIETSSSRFDEGALTVQYTGDPSLRFSESVSRDWRTNTSVKSPVSISPAPAFTHPEKHIMYTSALRCNSAEIPDLVSNERKRRLRAENCDVTPSSDSDEVEEAHTPFLQHDTAEYHKLYSAHVPLIRTRIDSETRTRLSCVSTPLTIDVTDTGKYNSKFSFHCRKEKMEVAVRGTTSSTPSCVSESKLKFITGSSESHHPVSSLNHRKEHTLTQCSTSSDHNVNYSRLPLCDEKGKQHSSLLRMISNTPSSPVPTHGKSTSLDADTVDTAVSRHPVPARPCRRVRYKRKVCSTTPFPPSLQQTLLTDGSVALQPNLAESVDMHRSEKSIPLTNERSQSNVVITPVPAAMALTFSQDRNGTAYAPLHCNTADDSKLHRLNRSLPRRRDRARFATKKASKEPQHAADPESGVPAPKKPHLRVYKEAVPRLEHRTQVSAISRTLAPMYN